jgi:hypothetical protein
MANSLIGMTAAGDNPAIGVSNYMAKAGHSFNIDGFPELNSATPAIYLIALDRVHPILYCSNPVESANVSTKKDWEELRLQKNIFFGWQGVNALGFESIFKINITHSA